MKQLHVRLDDDLYRALNDAAHDNRQSMNAYVVETIRGKTTAVDTSSAVPGWYMSVDTRLRENMVYLLTDATHDGRRQWYTFFNNGDGGACEPGYIDQVGPIVPVGRFIGEKVDQ